MFNFVGEFNTKLEVQASIIDTPAFVDAQIDAIIGICNQVIQRPCSGFQTHIRHANHWQAVPTIGTHTAITRESKHRSSIARHQVTAEDTAGNYGSSLRRNSLVIPTKGP